MENNGSMWTVEDGKNIFTVTRHNHGNRHIECSCHGRACKHIAYVFPGRTGGPTTHGLKILDQREIALPKIWVWF